MKALLVAAAILLADAASKWATQTHLPLMHGPYPYGGIPLFQNFLGIEGSIVHATNTGAAWGFMSEHPDWLLAGRLVLVALLILYLIAGKRPASYTIPLTMIIAGAIGNLIDTFTVGHVTDMFHFVFFGYSYPVFNIADMSIFFGIVILLLLPNRHAATA